MVIDFHTHIFPPRVIERRTDLLGKDPCFKTLYSNPKAKMATAEDLLSSMERDEIDLSVVLNIGWTDSELCRETNDYLLDSAARYPEKLLAFCMVNPGMNFALEELERCLKGGARGIGELRPDLQKLDPASERTITILELASKEGLIVLSHASEPVGHLYPGKGQVTPDVLYQFASRLPELRLVLAHWGGGLPFYALMPEVERTLQNVFFDTAATPFLYREAVFKVVCQIMGSDKILLGSDFPLISQARMVRQVEQLSLPREDRERILGQNALHLLKLGRE